jgi:hypothetical protein
MRSRGNCQVNTIPAKRCCENARSHLYGLYPREEMPAGRDAQRVQAGRLLSLRQLRVQSPECPGELDAMLNRASLMRVLRLRTG